MWLTHRLTPDHKTIAQFRRNNGKAIVAVCGEFVGICHRLSLIPGSTVAVDGSKFKAVNNRDKNFTAAKMERRKEGLEGAVNHYLAELDKADKAEPEVAQAKVPAIEARLEKLREEVGKLKVYEQQLEASREKQLSLTDPDSRAMNTRGSAVVGYNVQTATETTNHLIVTHEVVTNPIDNALLSPMSHKARAAMGTKAIEVLSDRGYYTGTQIVECERAGIRTYVPKPLTSTARANGYFGKDAFRYEPEHDRYRCPAGELLPRRHASVEKGLRIFVYYAGTSACEQCSLKAQCSRSPQPRRIRRWEREDVLEKMQARLARAPETLQLRRQTAEHPFGTIKGWMGYTHFLTRTLPNVRTEMSLQVLAYNIKRVINLIGVASLLKGLQPA
jgi:transposase